MGSRLGIIGSRARVLIEEEKKMKKERERYERRRGRGLRLVGVAAATARGSGWRWLAVACGGCKAADSGWRWLAAARGGCSNTRQRSSKAHVPPLSFSPFLFFSNYMGSFFFFSNESTLLILHFFFLLIFFKFLSYRPLRPILTNILAIQAETTPIPIPISQYVIVAIQADTRRHRPIRIDIG